MKEAPPFLNQSLGKKNEIMVTRLKKLVLTELVPKKFKQCKF